MPGAYVAFAHCTEHDFVRNVQYVWNVWNTYGTYGTTYGSNIAKYPSVQLLYISRCYWVSLPSVEVTYTHVGVRAWPHAVISSLGARARGGGGQAPAFRVARCQTWTGVRPKIGRKFCKIIQKQTKSTKVNMLKSGDVDFEFGFEW